MSSDNYPSDLDENNPNITGEPDPETEEEERPAEIEDFLDV